FTVAGQTVVAAVSGGKALASLPLPAGFAPGQYAVTAIYADAVNGNGQLNFSGSGGTGMLSVNGAPVTVQITGIRIVTSGRAFTERITAKVTSPAGTVNGGTVTFNVGGTVVTANVSGGVATATLTVPFGFGGQGVSAMFDGAGGSFATGGDSRTAV